MINPKQGAVVHTRQEAIRACIQAIVWASWSAAFVWYGWGFWLLLFGKRATTLDSFAFDWTSGGWFGAIAAMFAIRYAVSSFGQFFGIALPFLIKSCFGENNDKKERRRVK